MNLESMLLKLESSISRLDEVDEHISKVSVGWQIEHSFKVILAVCKTIQASDPKSYTAKFSMRKSLILAAGWFPRGKVKAPKTTRPVGEITESRLKSQLELVRSELSKMDSLEPNSFFYHPIFGNLNLKTTHRFLAVHTNHHLKIIADILKEK